MNINNLTSNRIYSLLLLLILMNFLTHNLYAHSYYVSPSGKDSNPGSEKLPFKTIEHALRKISNLSVNESNKNFTIILKDGLYQIDQAIVISSDDFDGRNSLSIQAAPNANPIISGGVRLDSWEKDAREIWACELPADLVSGPRELFIGNQRAIRARHPNKGYLRVKKVGDDRRTNFQFKKGDFPIPETLNNVELVLLHDWSISRIGISRVNKEQLFAVDSIGARSPSFFNLDHWEKNPRYFLENDLRFIDSDREWCYDSNSNKIFLQLPDGQNPRELEIFVPLAEQLLRISGTFKKSVKNIEIKGITFKHCKWHIDKSGYCGVQACFHDPRPGNRGWKAVPPAVFVDRAEACSFSACKFQNLGTSGVWIKTAGNSCIIEDSHFTDISGNGIMIGEGRERIVDGEVWWKTVPEEVTINTTIKNCTVTNTGAQFYGSVGIWCGFVAKTKIVNNELSALPYSGISIGWEWSPAKSPCRENIVDNNHIHHILNILSDGGGIYMLGLQPGSKLTNNHIHDVKINAGRAESNGMFLDEGTTDVVVAHNLIYNIAKSPLRFHRATTNLVKENYLFCTNGNPPIRYNTTNEEDIKKEGNKVYLEGDATYQNELKKAIAIYK